MVFVLKCFFLKNTSKGLNENPKRNPWESYVTLLFSNKTLETKSSKTSTASRGF